MKNNFLPNSFVQNSENSPAELIIVHEPAKEVFMSMLHPAASLYNSITNEDKIKESFQALYEILVKKDIKYKTVRQCLKMNRKALLDLAQKSITYQSCQEDG